MTVTVPHIEGQLNVGIDGDVPLASTRAIGVDNIHAEFALIPPQNFAVTLPEEVSDGAPSAGAGNIEKPFAEDIYTFTLAQAGNVQVDISDCSDSLSWVHYKLVSVSSEATVSEGWSCWSQMVEDMPAGDYQLSVTNPRDSGTYHLDIGLQPAAQSFALSLPKTVSNGDPTTGAGNLETTSSEDDYTFATTGASTVTLELSECASTLGSGVRYELIDTGDDHTIKTGTLSCGGYAAQLRNIIAGSYKLVVTNNGKKGTYELDIDAVEPQTFVSALPFAISDGVPSAGAGNLETGGSEDVYTFTTTATGNLQIDISDCDRSLSGLGALQRDRHGHQRQRQPRLVVLEPDGQQPSGG